MKPRRRTTRSTTTSRRKPFSPAQIRAQLTNDYLARQIQWGLGLDAERIDWTQLLSLHLQLTELEHLTESLEDFA